MEYVVKIKDYIQLTDNNIKEVCEFLKKYEHSLEYAVDEEDKLPFVLTKKDNSIICVFYNDYLCIDMNDQVYRISPDIFENLLEKNVRVDNINNNNNFIN